MSRHRAWLFLILLLPGLLGPLWRATIVSPTCCCPDGVSRCETRADSCSWRSGCGASEDGAAVAWSVFSSPPTIALAVLDPAGGFDDSNEPPVASRKIPVSSPPPRA